MDLAPLLSSVRVVYSIGDYDLGGRGIIAC